MHLLSVYKIQKIVYKIQNCTAVKQVHFACAFIHTLKYLFAHLDFLTHPLLLHVYQLILHDILAYIYESGDLEDRKDEGFYLSKMKCDLNLAYFVSSNLIVLHIETYHSFHTWYKFVLMSLTWSITLT